MYLWYLPVAKRNGMLNKPLDLENVTLLGHLKAGSYESKKVDAVVIKCSAPHRTDWGYEKESLERDFEKTQLLVEQARRDLKS